LAKTASLLLVILFVGGLVDRAFAEVNVDDVRFWTAPDHTRVVVDLSGPAAYDLRRLTEPHRVSVTIADAGFTGTATVMVGDPVLTRIRSKALEGKAQIVLDLTGAHRLRHFVIPAADGRPDRIVIDVERPEAQPALPTVSLSPQAGENSGSAEARTEEPFVIVVDPGHGGLDPGAIRQGLREKDIVLDIGRELARIIDARPGYRAALTRAGDHDVKLARRIQLAREVDGDLFVSVHVNTHANASIKGMEVYFLALHRAEDREARELADRENASLMMGVSQDEALDDVVLPILMDMRMSRIVTSSNMLADQVLAAARRSPILEARTVKQAVFHVLQSLAMPSALVEVAYLSNPDDRALLTDPAGRRNIAAVMAEGIFSYLGDKDPDLRPRGQDWLTVYRVNQGDTLWGLARRYATTVREIKDRNRLTSNRLQIDQTLSLP